MGLVRIDDQPQAFGCLSELRANCHLISPY
jgi:hypothetical protein